MSKINNIEFLTLPQQVMKNKRDVATLQTEVAEHGTSIDEMSQDLDSVSTTVVRELAPLTDEVDGFTYNVNGNTFTHSGLWESGEMKTSEVLVYESGSWKLKLNITPLTQNMVIIYRLLFDGPGIGVIELTVDGVFAPVSPETSISYEIANGKTRIYDPNPAMGGGGSGYLVIVGINGCMVSCTSGFAFG